MATNINKLPGLLRDKSAKLDDNNTAQWLLLAASAIDDLRKKNSRAKNTHDWYKIRNQRKVAELTKQNVVLKQENAKLNAKIQEMLTTAA